MWQIASATDSYRPDTEDRAAVVRRGGAAIVAVADGVGGRAGGAAAAEVVTTSAAVLDPLAFLANPMAWVAAVDFEIGRHPLAGESTAVVAVLAEDGSTKGVAVGDSAAWWIDATGVAVLSAGSESKPWLGWGAPSARSFTLPTPMNGVLLLATDGLLKYASPEAIRSVVRAAPFDTAPKRLIELVRLPSGGFHDDLAVVVVKWGK